MIIRVFRTIVHEGQEATFRALFVGTLLPLVRAQEGLLSASVGLPHPSSPREFCMITRWRDMESLRAFTGANWRTAVVHPDEADLLAETFVHHFLAHEG